MNILYEKNNLATERQKYNLENCKKSKSVSCQYNDDGYLWIGYLSLFLRTIVISFILLDDLSESSEIYIPLEP